MGEEGRGVSENELVCERNTAEAEVKEGGE